MSGQLDVVAAILWKNGRFLAIKRPEGKQQAGFWEFPGGKIEAGESPEEALSRELQEELNLTPLSFRFWTEKVHAYDNFRVRLRFFHVDEFCGPLVAHEGHEWMWIEPKEPVTVPFLAADVDIVHALQEQTVA